ncbi:hypothetical protein MMC20_000401 [Loxospora ochrophaea]|nr:hypothetical protein [Loxospora ochrophaea]
MPSSDITVALVSPGEILAAAVVFPVISIVGVALRLWTRIIHKKQGLGADDYLISLALVFLIGMGICLIVGVAKHAVGYPTPEVPNATPEEQLTETSPEQTTFQIVQWVFWPVMTLTYGFIKLSAVFFYRRIFVTSVSGKRSLFDAVTIVTIGVISAWTSAFFLYNIFRCGSHFAWAWGPLVDMSKCGSHLQGQDALMITDLLTDVFVWVLPVPMIWSLGMPLWRKLSVTGIMMLAAISIGASITRLVVVIEIDNGGYGGQTDPDFTVSTALYWSMVEGGLALAAACLPTLHYLFGRKAMKSAISTLRSAIALNTLRSHHSKDSQVAAGTPYSELKTAARNGSQPSDMERLRPSEGRTDTDVTPQAEYGEPTLTVPGKVRVREDTVQSVHDRTRYARCDV